MHTKEKTQDNRPFSEKHPRWNMFFSFLLLIAMLAGGTYAIWIVIQFIGKGISKLLSLASSLDAVVIVALITGTVSIVGVIISSVVAKRIDYKKSRQQYLAQKREQPYGEFIEMVYKLQQNSKNPDSYTSEQMVTDISRFSRQITLWGSPNVVKKWVQFRENGMNPNAAQDNLFVLEDIMNEMRKDMGLKKVKKGNLLAFFINDIKQVMNSTKK